MERLEGNLAYVDEDGFITPVLQRECVVVAHAGQQPSQTTFTQPKPAVKPETAPRNGQAPAPTVTPVAQASEPEPDEEEEEVQGGDKLNVMLAFEPVDIMQLTKTTFDAFLVNDSNYYLNYTLMRRAADEQMWTLVAAGTIEPNIQLLVANIDRDTFPRMDRLCFQVSCYKRTRPFELKPARSIEIQVDTTKFCKLHCFRDNIYFDTRVLAFRLFRDDEPMKREKPVDAAGLEREMMRKKRADRRPVVRRTNLRADRRNGDIIEVDLHIEQLIDNIRGLSNADILNRQIDEFTRVMEENIRNHGQKIVFIHGKGEGVLRQALMKELTHRFKGHDVQDASFQEYGYGATQVIIR